MKTFKLFITGVLICCTMLAAAFPIRSGEKVTISEPTEGNLYLAGEDIDINAITKGDLIVAGGEITVRDSLMDDALIAGGKIRLNGVASDDVRMAGGQIIVESDVYGDLVIGGGDITVTDEVTVYGDLIVAGGDVEFAGFVKGLTKIYGGTIDFKGIAGGEVEMKGGDIDLSGTFEKTANISANNVIVQPLAKLKSDVNYYTRRGKIDFEDALKDGATANFDPDLKPTFGQFDEDTFRRGMFGLAMVRFFSVALLISLVVLLFPKFFRQTPNFLGSDYLNSLVTGLLYVLLVPIGALIALFSVIGFPVGLISGSLFAMSIGLGHVFAAVIGANYYNAYKQKNLSKGGLILTSIGFWVVLKIIGFIPIIGGIIGVIAALLGFGAIIRAIRDKSLERDQVMTEDSIVPH